VFKHIRLATIRSWFLAIILLTTVVSSGSLVFVTKQVQHVDQSWLYFKAEQSEKALLENHIREQLGFNGMVHNLKNYVLRGREDYFHEVQKNIGALYGLLDNYQVLVLNEAERVALSDIRKVIDQYDRSLLAARQAKSQGYSAEIVDTEIYVQDEPALHGLEVLRIEMRTAYGNTNDLANSKTRALSDLNAEVGYGGLIHSFKNYVIRQRSEYYQSFLTNYQNSQRAINHYSNLELTSSEQLVLREIQLVIEEYRTNLDVVKDMAMRGSLPEAIDAVVKVDDGPMIRGLQILKTETAQQTANALNQVDQSLISIRWVVVGVGLAFALFFILAAIVTYWVLTKKVIQPIQTLTDAMHSLTEDKLDISISGAELDNEMGDMTRSVKYFQQVLQNRVLIEQRLESSNEELNNQLKDNLAYRNELQQQAMKAINLSEGLLQVSEEAKSSAKKAAESEKQVSSILEAVSDAIIVINSKGVIEQFNPGAQQMFGYNLNDIVGQSVNVLMTDAVASKHQDYLDKRTQGKAGVELRITGEQVARHREGYEFPVEINLSLMRVSGEVKYIGVMRDISERKRWEAQIQRMAMTDPLTGLANRTQFSTRLNEAVEMSKRHGHLIGLMMIDLDKFKPVNDTYGHPVGDQLLKNIARIFKKRFREVDTVARLGGDEFAVVLAGIDSVDNMTTIAQEVIDTLSKPMVVSNHELKIGCSIGLCAYPTCANEIKTMLQKADDALYQAKKDGRNCYRMARDVEQGSRKPTAERKQSDQKSDRQPDEATQTKH
jgi:diguanylate cyclase (GGDEF)-like protein/PAS domain S-box-containing protein